MEKSLNGGMNETQTGVRPADYSGPETPVYEEKQAGTLRRQVLLTFETDDLPPGLFSPLPLAFLGDAVYSLVIRTILMEGGNRQAEKLHRESADLVNASAQAMAAEAILPVLTEEELKIYRRGHNANPAHHAKGASLEDYLKATGLETLCGYLYLKDETGRLLELIKAGLEGIKNHDK